MGSVLLSLVKICEFSLDMFGLGVLIHVKLSGVRLKKVEVCWLFLSGFGFG